MSVIDFVNRLRPSCLVFTCPEAKGKAKVLSFLQAPQNLDGMVTGQYVSLTCLICAFTWLCRTGDIILPLHGSLACPFTARPKLKEKFGSRIPVSRLDVDV